MAAPGGLATALLATEQEYRVVFLPLVQRTGYNGHQPLSEAGGPVDRLSGVYGSCQFAYKIGLPVPRREAAEVTGKGVVFLTEVGVDNGTQLV